MPDLQAVPERRCASPLCRKVLPADATGRRRYCSGACRQAAWRIDHPAAVPKPDPASPDELAALQADVRRRAAHLAVHAQHVADPLAGSGKQAVALRSLPGLVEGLLAAHVAARRAAGDAWEHIGQALEMHPDTARRRFGQQQADDRPAPPPEADPHDPTPETAAAPSSPREQAVEEPADRTGGSQATPAPVDERQALTETSGEGLAEQGASAVPAAAEQTRTVDQKAPAAPASDLYLVQLGGENCLFLVDGERAGWLHAAPDGWQVHGHDGRLVTTLPVGGAHGHGVGIGLNLARLAAAALGIPGAERAAVTVGPLQDDRGRSIDTSPAALASWSLLKGRVPGRGWPIC
ncbi:hypothetical protein [Nonomuraea sp. NPDC049141]|uniref:hypothetical protein n=1 Tax=Nonomuraea sp. NPDC049141 TaxID=3155500 RepID=UPI0033CC4E69